MEVVSAVEQEAEGADAILALRIERFAVDRDRRDMAVHRRIGVVGVRHIVREAQLQIRAARGLAVRARRALPLLLEHRLDLLPRERRGPQVVEERQNRVRLRNCDLTFEELGTQSARVHDTDLGTADLWLAQRLQQSIGDEVAERRFARTVVTNGFALTVRVVRSRDVSGRLTKNHAALLLGRRQCRLRGLIDGANAVVLIDEVLAEGLLVRGSLFVRRALFSLETGMVSVGLRRDVAVGIHAQHNLTDVLAVAARLHDGTTVVGPRVFLVRVTGEDRVHVA